MDKWLNQSYYRMYRESVYKHVKPRIICERFVEGENNEIALNSQFLLDALGNMGGGKVIFEIGEKTTPIILKPKEGSGYTHIIMPLKI